MKIIVNGKPDQVREDLSLQEYILQKNLRSDHIVIELNHTIVKSERWHTVSIQEGDRIEIVRLVGGG